MNSTARALLAVCGMFVCVSFARAQIAVAGFEWLGTLGGNESFAFGINSLGHVTGYSKISGGAIRAFLFDETGMHNIGVLTGGSQSIGYDINDLDQIAGSAVTSGGDTHAFFFAGADDLEDLETLGGNTSAAWALNNAGRVTGSSLNTAGEERAFFYDGAMNPITGGVEGDPRIGLGINEQSHVIGSGLFLTPEGVRERGFIWDGATFEILGVTAGFDRSIGHDVNELGHGAGQVRTLTASNYHAFYYNGHFLVDIGTLPGGTNSVANALNDADLVIGTSDTGGLYTHPFLYQRGARYDLNTLAAGFLETGDELRQGYDVTNNGWLTGNGFRASTGRREAWRIKLVPEPSAGLAVAAASALLLLRRKAR